MLPPRGRGQAGWAGEQSPTRPYSFLSSRQCEQELGRARRNYKKAHAQARIKAQANDGTAKFGAANSAAHKDTSKPTVDNQLEVEDVGITALEGYLNNLAVTAVNKKSVLQKLVLNNTTLATSNESLVALVKNLTGDIKNLERENSRLKKGGQVRNRSTTLCNNCNKEGCHQPEACYELLKNKYKRPPGWRRAL